MEDNQIETCVLCGKETRYRFNDHIDFRDGYIEGVGQMCNACYDLGVENGHIAVPISMIKETPNNYELGEKIRKIFNDIV